MQDSLEEVVLCPNCKEEVPRTLYCLNCGYALYKEEQAEQEKTEVSEEALPSEPVIEEEITQPETEPAEAKVEVEPATVEEVTEAHVEPIIETPVVEPVEAKVEVEPATVEEVTEAPVEPAIETPVEEAIEAKVEAEPATVEEATEAPVEPAIETPEEVAVEAKVEVEPTAAEKVVETLVEEPVEAKVEVEQATVEEAIETPVEEAVEAPVEEAIEKPVEPVVEEPKQALEPVEEPPTITEELPEKTEEPTAQEVQPEIKSEEIQQITEERGEVEAAPPKEEAVCTEEVKPVCAEETIVKDESLVETAKVEVTEETHVEPVVEELIQPPVTEPPTEVKPDPLVREIMENLAKNVSLKVKLVKLLQCGDIQESTFKRIFEGFAAGGERWMNRRNEMLEKNKYDIGTMEKELGVVKTELEELEIRRTIGDASEEEYSVKAPAYEWGIDSIDCKLQQKGGDIAHLEDLSKVMPSDDAQKIREITECCSLDLDRLVDSGKVSSETASRIRATLDETLELIKSAGS